MEQFSEGNFLLILLPPDPRTNQRPSEGCMSCQGVEMVEELQVILVVEEVTGATFLLVQINQKNFMKEYRFLKSANSIFFFSKKGFPQLSAVMSHFETVRILDDILQTPLECTLTHLEDVKDEDLICCGEGQQLQNSISC